MASMTNMEVLSVAQAIIGDRAYVTIHKSDGNAVAVRLSGCALTEAERLGAKLAARLPGDLRSSGGFVAVWFDRRNVSSRMLHERVGEPPMLDYDEAMYT